MTDLQGTYVPKDYQDLYHHYIEGNGGSLGQVLVRRFVPGESNEVREDLLQDVYIRMQAKDVLKLYDPTKCNFGGVVYFVVRTVCVNYLKKKGHDHITNLKSATLEESSSESDFGERGVMYLDRMESEDRGEEGLVSAIDAQRTVEILRNDIDYTVGSRSEARAVHLHRLVDLLCDGYSIAECAEQEGVTVSTIYNWLKYLKSLVEG